MMQAVVVTRPSQTAPQLLLQRPQLQRQLMAILQTQQQQGVVMQGVVMQGMASNHPSGSA